MGGAWCSVVGAWLGSWWQRGGAAWTTLAVVLFLEGSLVLGAIVPLGALDSAWGGAAVLALQALVLLALTSGIIVTSADPGYVPRHQPAAHDGDEEEPAESEAATGRISLSEFLTVHERECSLCFAPKPTNAHHCSVCQRCVIKMDHHCIYLNNCIGNMKAFLLFLVYALLCSLCAFAFFVARAVQLYHTADNHSEEDLTWPIVLAVVNLGLLSLAIIATTGLCVRHLLAILRNQTVLETILKKPPMHNPGALANLKGVFGGAPWLWMLPTLATDPPSESHDSARFVDTRELAPAVVGRHHQYGEHDDDDDDGVSSPLH